MHESTQWTTAWKEGSGQHQNEINYKYSTAQRQKVMASNFLTLTCSSETLNHSTNIIKFVIHMAELSNKKSLEKHES